MSDLMSSLKRLERAGSESSRATQKLHEAASEVPLAVQKMVPEGVELPRGYTVRRVHSNVGSECFLTYYGETAEMEAPDDLYVDGCGGYLHGDFHCPIPSQTRETSMHFARDIAEGWLDEVAAFLEQRAAKATSAAEGLNHAGKGVHSA